MLRLSTPGPCPPPEPSPAARPARRLARLFRPQSPTTALPKGRRVIALVGVVAVIGLFATGAQAQTTCNAPDLTGRTQIWSATLTVAHGTFNAGYSNLFGSLSDQTFSIGSSDFTIEGITVSRDAISNLIFNLESTLGAGDQSRLRLHVCDRSFDFSAAAYEARSHTYSWRNSGVSWAAGATVTVALSVEQPPCPAPDLAGRTQVWSATLTVGHGTFNAGYSSSPAFGSLSDRTFSIGSSDFTIEGITVSRDAISNLIFNLESTLGAGDQSRLRLHVCDRSFDFSAAAYEARSHTYSWRNSGVSWGEAETRWTIRLSVVSPTAATGAPVISGMATVGQLLTAAAGTVADADGLPAASTFAWRWIRVDSDGTSNRVVIEDATSTTYRLVAADNGKKIEVELRFTDNGGNLEARTSAAFPAEGTVVLSSDARLTSLAISNAEDRSGLEIEPAFVSSTTAYAVQATTELTRILIATMPVEQTATIRYLDGSDQPFPAANTTPEGHYVDVVEGPNTVKIEVTAPDRTTIRVYTITVTVTEPAFTGVLVENMGEAALTATPTAGVSYMQAFTTGGHRRGFEFESVVLRLQNVRAPSVEIWAADTQGRPGAMQWRLSRRSALPNTFDAPSGARLEPDRTYFVHVSVGRTTGDERIGLTQSDGETGRAGWKIGNDRREGNTAGWTESGDGGSLRLRVTGSTLSRFIIPAAEPDDDEVDWKTAVTVGNWHVRNRERERGWRRDICERTRRDTSDIEAHSDTDMCYGAIGNRSFSVGETTYPVEGVYHFVTQGNDSLVLEFDEVVDLSALEDRTFWINGHEFPVSKRYYPSGGGTSGDKIVWSEPVWTATMGWRVGSTIWVGLLAEAGMSSMQQTESKDARRTDRTRDKGQSSTARFADLPERHDGATPFSVELHFSEEPTGLSYKTVAGGLLAVSGAEVTKARRLNPPSNQGWEVDVTPVHDDDIVLTLPARACGKTDAVCFDGQPLARAATATVPGVPLTAELRGMPGGHDGRAFTFELRLSEDVAGLSYETVRDSAFAVTGGTVTRARRLVRGQNHRWDVRVQPGGYGDVTIALPATRDCAAPGAICTPQGKKQASAVSMTVQGPVTLSVADAEVEENAPDASLAFVVTLSRARDAATTVAYATADGTARAGQDYTATSGTLTFAAGETSQTVQVPVLDDALDEGNETMTLTLSNPVGAALDDAEATGTIRNSDPLPRAWLSRFGRTVGTHVTDAVGERLRAPPGLDSYVMVGGYRLPLEKNSRSPRNSLSPGGSGPVLSLSKGQGEGAQSGEGAQPGAAERDPVTAVLTEVARVLGMGPGGSGPAGNGEAGPWGRPGWDPWLDGPAGDPRLGRSRTLNVGRTFTLRRALLGTSFRLALGAAEADSSQPRLTAWGRFAGTRFAGRDGDVTVDGDVFTGTVGVDGTWDRWLAGVAVAHSRGEGGYSSPLPVMAARGPGTVETALTSLHPYLQYAVTDRLDVWGLLGYGWGEVEVGVGPGAALETDTQFVMGAFGGRGLLLAPADHGGFQLATRTDVQMTRTTSDAVTGASESLAASEADAHRLRVILEGSRGVTWAEGRTLTPTVEVGLRHDWGDAETGFGLEVGGRVQYADPSLGLTVDAAVRGLVAHEDEDYDEWGASGTIRVAPGTAGQGLSLTVAPAWGATASGVNGLWSRQTTQGLAPQGPARAQGGRVAADVGYGVALFNLGLVTPYAGTVLADGQSRTYRVGMRLRVTGGRATGLAVSLEGARQESTGPQPVNQGLRLQVTWGF